MIGQVEEILARSGAPDKHTFRALARVLGNGDVSEAVLQRIEAALASWPPGVVREAPWEWVSRACRGWSAPALRLANRIDTGRKTFQAKQMQALAASPLVSGLTALHNDPSSRSDIGDAGCLALAASPHLVGLTRLELWDTNSVTEVGALALVRSPIMDGMEHLMLRMPRAITNAVAEAILDADHFGALRHLDLTFSALDAAHRQRLRESPKLSGVQTFFLG